MATITELQITRVIDNVIVALHCCDVEVEVTSDISGKYVPACIHRAPEDCYPAEYPEVSIISAITLDDLVLVDNEGDERLAIPKGTDILAELSASQIESLEDEALNVPESDYT